MLSPNNPVRFYISYKCRKHIRSINDRINYASFSRTHSHEALPVLVKKESSPNYRNFKGISQHLFINKLTNLHLAIEKINGVVIKPGETFSFWNLVGNPSRENGFLSGLVIERGLPREGIGGGLCQLTNLIHWLALHSELKVTERHRHSFDIFPDDFRTVPFGTGATIVYNYKDLRLFNCTDQPYQLLFDLTDDHLTGELRAVHKPTKHYEIIERDHSFIQQKDGLYRKNSIYRKKTDLKTGNPTETLLFHNFCLCRYSIDEAGL